jgi:predicted RNase H-like HicB family nuclease
MRKYLIVIEKTSTGYSAFCPDLPGCVATAKTKSGVVRSMGKAIEFHLEGMRLEKLKIPKPSSSSLFLEVKAA